MKTKIQKYFKLQREIDKLKINKLEDNQSKIFMSKFKTNGIYADASGIFDVFLENPDKTFDRWIIKQSSKWKWSDESLDRNINKILQIFYEENLIIRKKKGYYMLNPIYKNTIKRNKKEEII